jgi:hypothetical protein
MQLRIPIRWSAGLLAALALAGTGCQHFGKTGTGCGTMGCDTMANQGCVDGACSADASGLCNGGQCGPGLLGGRGLLGRHGVLRQGGPRHLGGGLFQPHPPKLIANRGPTGPIPTTPEALTMDGYGTRGGHAGILAAHHGRHHRGPQSHLGPYPGPADGPPSPTVTYPYYTTRGPRDFLMDNPPTIGR